MILENSFRFCWASFRLHKDHSDSWEFVTSHLDSILLRVCPKELGIWYSISFVVGRFSLDDYQYLVSVDFGWISFNTSRLLVILEWRSVDIECRNPSSGLTQSHSEDPFRFSWNSIRIHNVSLDLILTPCWLVGTHLDSNRMHLDSSWDYSTVFRIC